MSTRRSTGSRPHWVSQELHPGPPTYRPPSQVDYDASHAELDTLRRVLRGGETGSYDEDGYDDGEEALTWGIGLGGVDWDAEYGLDNADAVHSDWDAFAPLAHYPAALPGHASGGRRGGTDDGR